MTFGQVEWHYGPNVARTERDDTGEDYHGSCVASKAAGIKEGVSKNSRLVIMKASTSLADTHWAFSQALKDIQDKGRQGKAVIVYPMNSNLTYSPTSVMTDWGVGWERIRLLIQDLFEQGVITVVSAGNDAKRSSDLDTLPALWKEEKRSPLVVAGAVTNKGAFSTFSQGITQSPRTVTWAPGDSVKCAGKKGIQTASGTSFSAAMVKSVFSRAWSCVNDGAGCWARRLFSGPRRRLPRCEIE